jgi:hypothetical protein
MAEPFPQPGARREVLAPLIKGEGVFADSAGPYPIHQDAISLGRCRDIVHTHQLDIHVNHLAEPVQSPTRFFGPVNLQAQECAGVQF